jgi:hypothetical protein
MRSAPERTPWLATVNNPEGTEPFADTAAAPAKAVLTWL